MLFKFLNNQNRYYYNAFELIYNIIDFWRQHKEYTTLFYDVSFEKSIVSFNILILIDLKIIVHLTTLSWRFEIDINKLKISKLERFVKDLQKQVIIYAFIIADVMTLSENKLKSSDFLENYLYLKNVFDNDLVEVLFKQDYKYHAINLADNKKFLYILLYNLS